MLQGEVVFELRLKGRTYISERADMGWQGIPGGGDSVSKGIKAGTGRHVQEGLEMRQHDTERQSRVSGSWKVTDGSLKGRQPSLISTAPQSGHQKSLASLCLLFPHFLDLYFLINSISSIHTFPIFTTFPLGLRNVSHKSCYLC